MGLPGGPYYVLKKNKKENHLVVTKEESDLFKKELFFEKTNFFRKMIFPETLDAKIRYRGSAVKALVEKNKLTFSSPQRAITSGQSVVFYKGDELIGGGIIK